MTDRTDMTNIMEVKPVTAEHLHEYAGVIRDSFATVARDFGLTQENCPAHSAFITDKRLEEILQTHDGYYPFGCFIGGKIIGFASLNGRGGGTYKLRNVAVLPEYRRLGYGKALLDFCKSKAAELGGNQIIIGIIEEHAELKNWYAANGFKHTGTEQVENLPFTVGYMEYKI